MRIQLPPGLTGKKLIDYLVKNKAELIAKKKMLPIKSDEVYCGAEVSRLWKPKSGGGIVKSISDMPDMEEENGVVNVKVVGNAAWWCDSHMDVLTDTCWDKSINDRQASGNWQPHIKNHAWDDCCAHVGDVQSVFKKAIKIRDLGYDKAGSTTCLLWDTDIKEEYDDKVYKFYKNGKINQHSIGLQYINLELAVNNKSSEKEYDFWNKYINKIINKDRVLEMGYFWLVSEIRVIECSSVLFGANELTPTYSTEEKSTGAQPEPATEQQPQKKKLQFGAIKF